MNLNLQNSWQYQSGDWWNWTAYLTGSDLPRVQFVEYVLHPSFDKPVRKVDDPAEGFKMETAGWGTFLLKAIVHLKDGKTELLTHDVTLRKTPAQGRTEE